MTNTLFVSVTTDITVGGAPIITSWIVATSDPGEAMQAIRALNPNARGVRVSDALISEKIVKRYNLKSY